ncbi:MAG TPA: helix-turn-helix transcriptional regulator [bacterium]|nr:helix-turn-helix transcriptional regulator [bacterium]
MARLRALDYTEVQDYWDEHPDSSIPEVARAFGVAVSTLKTAKYRGLLSDPRPDPGRSHTGPTGTWKMVWDHDDRFPGQDAAHVAQLLRLRPGTVISARKAARRRAAPAAPAAAAAPRTGVAEAIRKARTRASQEIASAAARAEVSEQTWAAWEAGVREPTPLEMLAIARALGCRWIGDPDRGWMLVPLSGTPRASEVAEVQHGTEEGAVGDAGRSAPGRVRGVGAG